jgi:hypothetical protein
MIFNTFQKSGSLFASFSFIMMFLSALSVCAQDTGVRADYARYIKLFEAGREPDMASDVSWRSAYSRNEWKKYADGTEFKDPLPEAQVLMGLYLLASVEGRLIYEIDNIAQNKALLSHSLSESIVLDQIATVMEDDPMFYTDAELVGDYRGIQSGMEKVFRQRITRSVPRNLMTEQVELRNMFRAAIGGGEAARYQAIRERISALDALKNECPCNWNDEKKEKEVDSLMTNARILKEAEDKARDEIDSRPNLSEEQKQRIIEGVARKIAQKDVDKRVAKYVAFKYVIGVYQGMDYHVRDLQQTYHYYLDAAEQGNVLARYHIVLFLFYFGDILDMEKEKVQQDCQNWLDSALRFSSGLARERVSELREQLALNDEKSKKQTEDAARRLEKLLKMEFEKVDMIENVLYQQAKRRERINEVQQRIIEEMERQRERNAGIERDYIKASAMVEAARLQSMQPKIIPFRSR